jgi:diguanylate cyclase (GGDEF)-like protein
MGIPESTEQGTEGRLRGTQEGEIRMRQNKLSGCSNKWAEHWQSGNYSIARAALRRERGSPSSRGNTSLFLSQNTSKASQNVFQKLLSETNQELATLTEDVHTALDERKPDGTLDGRINELLTRAIQFATKQHKLQEALGSLAFTDELTGLLNRRGFMTIAGRQLKVGHRSGRGMVLFFMDVVGLKDINDSFGHLEGDRALKHTSRAIEKTFRDSDLIARLGGDEFAVLAIEASDSSEAAIRTRLSRELKSVNEGETRYDINLSLGAARLEVRSKTCIEELMVRADQAMYEQKKRGSGCFPDQARFRRRD